MQSRNLAEHSSQLSPPSRAVPALIAALGDAKLRRFAAESLALIGPAAAEALPALNAALGDADQNVRLNAAEALAQIGPAAEEAGPALMAALGDADGDVRANAVKALSWIERPPLPGSSGPPDPMRAPSH